MLFTIVENVRRDRDLERSMQNVAECLLRQGGGGTNRIIAERTHLDDATIDQQAALLQERGLAESTTDERGRTFHTLTEAGRTQAEAWFEEHKAFDDEFIAALDDSEKEQLESLLAKALEPFMRRGPKRK